MGLKVDFKSKIFDILVQNLLSVQSFFLMYVGFFPARGFRIFAKCLLSGCVAERKIKGATHIAM